MWTLISHWANGGRLHRALPFQHVSFSANQGILAQLEWKYMQGKGVFNLILWGRGWRGIKFSHFFFFNDVSARESFLKRISGMFRRHIVVLRGGLRLPEIKFCKASEMSDHRGQMLGSQLLFHRPRLSWERSAVSPCVLLSHQGRRAPDEQQSLPEPHSKWPPVPGQAEGAASARARRRQRRVMTCHSPPFYAASHHFGSL